MENFLFSAVSATQAAQAKLNLTSKNMSLKLSTDMRYFIDTENSVNPLF